LDRDLFIKAMRDVAHSVTVVTTDGKAGRHGATVSAFCSVSADPPLALVCLNSTSKIAETVMENRFFNINILPEDASFIANRFAGAHDKHIEDRFSDIELVESKIPELANCTLFRCEVESTHKAGTHQIVIGKVLSATMGDQLPLTYLKGAYHQVEPLEVKPQLKVTNNG